MSNEKVYVWKAFFAWQDEEEEKWLEQKAREGLFLKSYSFLKYTFEKHPPREVAYRLDYKATKDNDIDAYLDLFEEAGWDHVGRFSGWHYFCAEVVDGITPEIYNDNFSKVEKYNGLLKMTFLVLMMLLVLSVSVIFNPTYPYTSFIRPMYIGLVLLLVFSSYKINKKIKRIKDSL